MGKFGSTNALDRIMREAAEMDRDNINCFENRTTDPNNPETSDLNEAELQRFEAVVIEWMDRQHGQERKAKAVTWFYGMLARLRNRIGTDEKQLDQIAEMDRIGMAIVSDAVVTLDGHASVGVERVAPRHSIVRFEGQESIRIIATEELKPSKCDGKLKTNQGELAYRELVFKDQITGKTETRRYTLVSDNIQQIRNGKVKSQWLTFEENYALSLIRSVLSEVSK